MSTTPINTKLADLKRVARKIKDYLGDLDFVLVYAYNGTGKTRLSMEFKDLAKKRKRNPLTDTLYFNAYTEDLFRWDNDLVNDVDRHLQMNDSSTFLGGLQSLTLEPKIREYLGRYTDFDFKIDYSQWTIRFNKGSQVNIKISRGEENIFIWCVFLAVVQVVIDDTDRSSEYKDIDYIYIDDPISSLDDNNAIAIASDLSKLLKSGKGRIKTVISSHHSLFFNIMYNELKRDKLRSFFLHKNGTEGYILRKTEETPFFHHVALLSELKKVADTGDIKTYHFNVMRNILEKTSTFFGYDDFSSCIRGIDDEALFARALNLLSHGKYSMYQPIDMNDDNKDLFRRILRGFLDKYDFKIPELTA